MLVVLRCPTLDVLASRCSEVSDATSGRPAPATANPPEATAAYYKRHGETFACEILPFGVGVFYYANKIKHKHQHLFAARLGYGVVVGYQLDLGHKRFGAYLGVDLHKFSNFSLDDFADSMVFSEVGPPHVTGVIKLEPKGVRFPLALKY